MAATTTTRVKSYRARGGHRQGEGEEVKVGGGGRRGREQGPVDLNKRGKKIKTFKDHYFFHMELLIFYFFILWLNYLNNA